MSKLTKQARLLRVQIEEAFADVPYPSNENLYDNGQLDDDYEDVIRHLTGKHWRDLIPSWKPLKGCSNPLKKDLVFCSPAAWHFFLPAYLIIEMMRGKISPFPLEPMRSEQYHHRLNARQCAVVVSFLVYADALLDGTQKKMPQHSNYFERERQELASVIAYWKSRVPLAESTPS